MDGSIWLWVGFNLFVLAMLALDLGVFHRKAHAVSGKEALTWSLVWISLSLVFNAVIYFLWDRMMPGSAYTNSEAALAFFTGYLIEKSLSVDNIFIFILIFSFFGVPAAYQHRVLFWGILGALAMRGAMIAIGAKLIHEFHWVLYVFAVFLIGTALKMLFMKAGHSDPGQNAMVKLVRRFFPVTARFHGEHFLVRAGSAASREAETPGATCLRDEVVEKAKPGTLLLTPLALALVMVETTDLIFAVDSIPAIFAITGDPFLVFTSNVFAILGLRSLYFALAGAVHKFRYLKVSLALVLLVVGVKMLVAGWLKELLGKHFNAVLLLVVLAILAVGVAASLAADRRDARRA